MRIKKKIAIFLFTSVALFTIAIIAHQNSFFPQKASANTWDQNQRSIGIYILPLTTGRAYNDDREEGDVINPAVWYSPQQLINIIDEHHARLASYVDPENPPQDTSADGDAYDMAFPAVVPVWVRTDSPGYLAPRGDQFPEDIMDHVREKGGVTMLDIHVADLAQWSNGTRDTWLYNFGQDIGEWMTSSNGAGDSDKGASKQNKVVIRVEPEVNADWQANKADHTDWSGNSYKAAITRMHDKLSEGIDSISGASSGNMKIMIHFANRDWNPTWHYSQWLPDDDSTWDILGISVYEKNKYFSQMTLIEDSIDNAVLDFMPNNYPNKYIWLAEIGVHYDANNEHRGTWLKDSLIGIHQHDKYAYRRVKAFIYSDYYDPTTSDDKGNWKLFGTNSEEKIARRYGELTQKYKFQQLDLFDR